MKIIKIFLIFIVHFYFVIACKGGKNSSVNSDIHLPESEETNSKKSSDNEDPIYGAFILASDGGVEIFRRNTPPSANSQLRLTENVNYLFINVNDMNNIPEELKGEIIANSLLVLKTSDPLYERNFSKSLSLAKGKLPSFFSDVFKRFHHQKNKSGIKKSDIGEIQSVQYNFKESELPEGLDKYDLELRSFNSVATDAPSKNVNIAESSPTNFLSKASRKDRGSDTDAIIEATQQKGTKSTTVDPKETAISADSLLVKANGKSVDSETLALIDKAKDLSQGIEHKKASFEDPVEFTIESKSLDFNDVLTLKFKTSYGESPTRDYTFDFSRGVISWGIQ